MSKKKKQNYPEKPAVLKTVATEGHDGARDANVDAGSFFKNPWLPALLVAAAAFVVYCGSLNNDFMSFDDGETIYYNNTIKNPTLIGLLTSRIVGMYVPVSALFYALIYKIGGEDPFAFHAFSLLLHAACSVMIWFFLRSLNLSVFVAFAAALLSAVHPVKVEPVAWVAAQTTLTYTLFYLASLTSWVRYRNTGRSAWQLGSLLFFALAALSKSAAVTLPLLLPVLDWYLGVHKDKFKLSRYAYLVPYVAVSVALGAYTFFTRTESGATISVSNQVFNILDRILMVSHTLLFYLYKLLIPIDLTVNYPLSKTGGSWSFDYWLAPLALAGLAYGLFKAGRQSKMYWLAAGLYLLPLSLMLPFVSVGNFELRSDRYLYFSSIGVFMLLAYGAERFFTAFKWHVLAVLTVAYAFLGYRQTGFWKNDAICFKHCVDLYPNSLTCNCNLAYGELLLKNYSNTIFYYNKALELDSTCYECRNGRGSAYLETRKIPEALEDFNVCVSVGMVSPKLFLNRGKCLVMLKRYSEALPDLDRSLQLEPRSAEAYYFRANARDKTGDRSQALEDYSKAIELNPNYIEAMGNKGFMLMNDKRYDEALALFDAAIRINPNIPLLLNNRAFCLLQQGHAQQALESAAKALTIDPKYAPAYQTRAAAYQALGRQDLAAAELAKIQPVK